MSKIIDGGVPTDRGKDAMDADLIGIDEIDRIDGYGAESHFVGKRAEAFGAGF